MRYLVFTEKKSQHNQAITYVRIRPDKNLNLIEDEDEFCSAITEDHIDVKHKG
jgi:hypothetical protein